MRSRAFPFSLFFSLALYPFMGRGGLCALTPGSSLEGPAEREAGAGRVVCSLVSGGGEERSERLGLETACRD